MHHRAGAAPQAPRGGRLEDHLAAILRDVEHGPGRILNGKAVQRHPSANAERPLIRVGQPGVIAQVVDAAVEGTRNAHGLFRVDRRKAVAGIGEGELRAALRRHADDRPAFERRDRQARDLAAGRRRSHHPHRRGSDGRQPGQPLVGIELRHARVDHDDAGDEPDEEQRAAADAEPAMRVNEDARGAVSAHFTQLTRGSAFAMRVLVPQVLLSTFNFKL